MTAWILFIVSVLFFLAVDLGIFNKIPRVISSKEAGIWTGIWVAISIAFSGIIYVLYDNNWILNSTSIAPEVATIKFITGYLIELSLSVDNIFVIALIFTSFKIPLKYQHRVLFWGIIGAIIFRGLMIYFGVVLVTKFYWMNYVFGLFLVFTALKMLFQNEEVALDPQKTFVFKLINKFIPVTKTIEGEHFFVKQNLKNYVTPLFVALLVIEVMDVIFALDSVPAIFAITSDPFIVFSSNIFAILGLRSLYFFLANMLEKFSYLEYSLIAILIFVGIKMLIHHYYEISEWISLVFIATSLGVGVLVSLKMSSNKE
ncbi:MAG: TerC family protein [Flavobacterium sp.]|nr:TerC family protein [Flavobacterium sp.]